MQYRTVTDDTERWVDEDDAVLQDVQVDAGHDTILGLRGVVELGVLEPNDLPFTLELWTYDREEELPRPFFKFYQPQAINPGVYTLDWRTSVPSYPQLPASAWEQQTDTVELRAEHMSAPVKVLRSEIQVLEL